jgi:hypothetical protein
MTLDALRRKGPVTGGAREFCDAVEQLRKCSNEVEAFINAVTRPDEFTAGANGRGSK